MNGCPRDALPAKGPTLGERLRAEGKPPVVPRVPVGSGFLLRQGIETVLELPRTEPRNGQWVAVIIGSILLLWLPTVVLLRPHPVPAFLLFTATVFPVVTWYAWVVDQPSRLTFGPEAIELRSPGLRWRIPFAVLAAVRRVEGDVVLASGTRALAVPYRFRDEPERRFVAALVEFAAYHHPRPMPVFDPSRGTGLPSQLQARRATPPQRDRGA